MCREVCDLSDGGIQASGSEATWCTGHWADSQSPGSGALSEGFMGMAISWKFFLRIL